ILRRLEVVDLPGAEHAELRGVEMGQPANPALLRAQSLPEFLQADADAGNGTEPRDDDASHKMEKPGWALVRLVTNSSFLRVSDCEIRVCPGAPSGSAGFCWRCCR